MCVLGGKCVTHDLGTVVFVVLIIRHMCHSVGLSELGTLGVLGWFPQGA